jgi:hypothetical protein
MMENQKRYQEIFTGLQEAMMQDKMLYIEFLLYYFTISG